MKKHEVNEIIVSIEENLSLKPSVSAEDKITDAIEVMLKNDLNRIAVIQEGTIVGMIRLEDALKKVGLEGDLKVQKARVVVRQGRKLVLDGTTNE